MTNMTKSVMPTIMIDTCQLTQSTRSSTILSKKFPDTVILNVAEVRSLLSSVHYLSSAASKIIYTACSCSSYN